MGNFLLFYPIIIFFLKLKRAKDSIGPQVSTLLQLHPKNLNESKCHVLDDESPTSANLGNDHGFISNEY